MIRAKNISYEDARGMIGDYMEVKHFVCGGGMNRDIGINESAQCKVFKRHYYNYGSPCLNLMHSAWAEDDCK